MKLIIVRHGETEENVKGIIQGQIQGTLTKKGIEQAQKLAERLKNEQIDFIFYSDLKRAIETFKEIEKFQKRIKSKSSKKIRERKLGIFQGRHGGDLEWRKVIKDETLFKKFGIEKTEDLVKRAQKFLDGLLNKFPDKSVLLVTHGGFASALNSILLKRDWFDVHSNLKPKNTCVTIYEFDKNKKPKLILNNCVKHLEENNGK